MMKIFKLTLIFIFFSLIASCMIDYEKESEDARRAMAGQYEVISIKTYDYDTLANITNSQTFRNLGSINLIYSESSFHTIHFNEVLLSNSKAFGYLSRTADCVAGDCCFYWDADPLEKRFFLWGIGPGSSYHILLNLEKISKREYNLSYVTSTNQNSQTAGTISYMEVIELEKIK